MGRGAVVTIREDGTVSLGREKVLGERGGILGLQTGGKIRRRGSPGRKQRRPAATSGHALCLPPGPARDAGCESGGALQSSPWWNHEIPGRGIWGARVLQR